MWFFYLIFIFRTLIYIWQCQQEEIRERIISSQADLEAETERSATALQLVEKDRESKREMARRVDKQYQRKM